MISISKQDNGVLFTFENSDKYLYGNGTIEVPFNSLSIIQDESDMITLRKAASNDIFLSARYDTDLGYASKDEAVEDLKDMLFAETGGGGTGSGVTSGEVQTMIDTALDDYYDKDEVDAGFDSVNATLSGKADTSAVTAVANDVQTVSGQVQTKVATSDFNAYSAATATALSGKADSSALNDYYTKTEVYNKQEVDSALSGKADSSDVYTKSEVDTALSGKQDTLVSGTNIKTINNESILGSGNINIQGGGSNVIELTQAQYDALSGSVDPSAIYVITDATAYDPSTKVDTSAITTSITSSSTNSEVAGAKAVYDAIQAGGGGGGATYSAGTNISIANDTINCTLPIGAGTGEYSLSIGNNGYGISQVSGKYAVSVNGGGYHPNTVRGNNSFAANMDNQALGEGSFANGKSCIANGIYSHAEGLNVNTNNYNEHSQGRYNNSVSASTTFGDSGNTLFSVGNGTSASARHNAFEIRQNGDIYVNDGTNDVRLQDTILALGGLKFVSLTQSEYDALVSGGTVDSSTIYFITNVVS